MVPGASPVLVPALSSVHVTTVPEPLLRVTSRHRIPMHQWWLKLRPLLRILAKHHATYEEDVEVLMEDDLDMENGLA